MAENLYRDPAEKTDADDLEKLFGKLADYKGKSIRLAMLWQSGFDIPEQMFARGLKMEDCGKYIKLGADDTENITISAASFCRQRLCPLCQYRRSLKTYATMRRVSDTLTAKGFVFLHVVLTVKNIDEDGLSAVLDAMQRNSSRMFKDSLLEAFKGILRCTEVTYNAHFDSYHPHFHCLVAVNPSYFTSRDYVSRAAMVSLWRKYARLDYDPQVWIERADDGALAEVSKYAVKPFDHDIRNPEQERHVYEVFDRCLGGRRLLQSYGNIRETLATLRVSLEDDESDDAAELDTVGEFLYNYRERKYESIERPEQ